MRGEAASTEKRVLGKSELNSGKLERLDPLAQPPKLLHENVKVSKPSARKVLCPECKSKRVWKDGLRYPRGNKGKPIQRWLCRNCGFRFSESSSKSQIEFNVVSQQSERLHSRLNLHNNHSVSRHRSLKETFQKPSLMLTKDFGVHNLTELGKRLNTFPYKDSKRRVCETDGVLKNLVKVEPRLKRAAGATTVDKATIKGKILELGWYMKKEGYKAWTIETYIGYLMVLMKRGANLYDPESVKETIAQQETWSESTKNTVVAAYKAFASFNEISWKPPKYKFQRKMPFIPLESEIDTLIANSGKKMATMLLLLKETAMRIGEAIKLKWIDVNLENNTVTVNAPEKGSNPRMFKISNKLAAMLNVLPRKNERVFATTSYSSFERNLHYVRKRTAAKLQNPRLLHIHFHTLRHWKATMEYHKTHDPWHVKQFLGHKSLRNTEIYINIEQAIFKDESDEYHSAVAKTIDEAKALIEEGFEYVCKHEAVMLFRKRK